jgi:hypothetical protein
MFPPSFAAHARRHFFSVLAAASLVLAAPAHADVRQELLAGYARAAGLSGSDEFSAARGETFHRARQSGGKPETPSCGSCHGDDPRQPGRAPTGKRIDAMALSQSPQRYTDPAKVEKWFRRNCQEVLGRACTPREKGDWLTFMLNR